MCIRDSIQSIRLVTYRDSGEVFSDAPFFADLIESIENESRRNGYETKLVNLYRREADYEQQVEDLLGDTSSAILLVGTELSEEDAKVFLTAQVPLVPVSYTHLDVYKRQVAKLLIYS